ncbi:MAG: hypothetical protein AAGF81_19395 [Pseudomonadota bacterium]
MALNRLSVAGIVLALFSIAAAAGEADVEKVTVQKASNGLYTFNVTVRHADEGWEHYANRWDVVAPDGTVLGTRVLVHPHVDEQPFTRSLRGVEIPEGLKSVIIRAHDSVHQLGGAEVTVELE